MKDITKTNVNGTPSRIDQLLAEIGAQVAEINGMSNATIAQKIADSKNYAEWAILISKQAELIDELQAQETETRQAQIAEGNDTLAQMTITIEQLRHDVENLNEQLTSSKSNEKYYREKWYADCNVIKELKAALNHLTAVLLAE